MITICELALAFWEMQCSSQYLDVKILTGFFFQCKTVHINHVDWLHDIFLVCSFSFVYASTELPSFSKCENVAPIKLSNPLCDFLQCANTVAFHFSVARFTVSTIFTVS